ncbi:predicted protein [Lichtheimia corymbifera JMRC:FSU:9682]|uniref:Uncharacterized protein n=1 Tax=Lichtheimia corymbifera JMRC:FSU:9682 TaxID=1263082 RepID=A0A068SG96_9FUNG|nr:predicted protein [Lichtheimia corymbifera JMRC:FSU:9682]
MNNQSVFIIYEVIKQINSNHKVHRAERIITTIPAYNNPFCHPSAHTTEQRSTTPDWTSAPPPQSISHTFFNAPDPATIPIPALRMTMDNINQNTRQHDAWEDPQHVFFRRLSLSIEEE